MKEVLKYPGCFVCGDLNESGLKAKFFYGDGRAVCEVTADERFEGYRGLFHGGIIATLLDEVMVKAILATDRYAVTAEMTVRYRAPVQIGDQLKFVGRVVRQKGRVYLTEGEAIVGTDQIVATATGKYVEARPDLKQVLLQSIE
jgi:uncharacterized protein (TIGR00369 family)